MEYDPRLNEVQPAQPFLADLEATADRMEKALSLLSEAVFNIEARVVGSAPRFGREAPERNEFECAGAALLTRWKALADRAGELGQTASILNSRI